MDDIKTDYQNFADNWTPLNGCEFESEEGKVYIKTINNDPYFESDFSIPEDKENLILGIINLKIPVPDVFQVYYKYRDSNYSQYYMDSFNLELGCSTIFIDLTEHKNLEKIRIDPAMSDVDCTIEKIELFYIN